MEISQNWQDYELIDSGAGEKLERWGEFILRRPDTQSIWPKSSEPKWQNPDMIYHRSDKGGGFWEFPSKTKKIPPIWNITYQDLKFVVKPTAFKHTGLFPEQAVNWGWMRQKIKSFTSSPKILNLFAYTGGATVACGKEGALVTHVDASRGMTAVAKENCELSEVAFENTRFIVDDVIKFVEREIRRGSFYNAIVMDPPTYGRGTNGELWQIEDNLFALLLKCVELFKEKPLFIIVNSYANQLSQKSLQNILDLTFKAKFGGETECGELGIALTSRPLILPCSNFARYF